MTSHEIAPNTSKPRNWVLSSTDASIANGQISWSAVIEIPLAMAFYGALAYISPWPWFSLMACLAAPVLLLRSEVSMRRGKVMLWRYARRRRRFSNIERLLIVGVMVLLCYWVSYALASSWIEHQRGWELFWCSVLIALFALGCAAAIVIAFVGEVAVVFVSMFTYMGTSNSKDGVIFDSRNVRAVGWLWRGFFTVVLVFSGAGAVAGAGIFVGIGVDAHVGAVLGASAGVGLAVVVTVLFIIMLGSTTNGVHCFEFVISLVLPIVTLGLLMRITWIRTLVTLRHLSSGLPAFSQNWRETVLVMDFWQPPVLLPGAEKVNLSFSVRNLMLHARYDWVSNFARFFILSSIYLPALLYRWNIKASTWLWGPLAFALRPTHWADDETMRERMSQQTSWPLLGLMGTVSLCSGVWLLGPWLPADLTSALPAGVIKVSQLLPAPEINLRTALLVPTLVAWSWLLWFAYNLRSPHDKPLGDADNYKKYDDVLKDRFRRLARPVLASGRWTAALAFLTVWAFALKWALNRWPQDLDHIVWDWLKPWL